LKLVELIRRLYI